MICTRVAMGLFSACAIPSVSAIAAAWFPPTVKGATLASIYLFFNIGELRVETAFKLHT